MGQLRYITHYCLNFRQNLPVTVDLMFTHQNIEENDYPANIWVECGQPGQKFLLIY